jgi:hypothetical protein
VGHVGSQAANFHEGTRSEYLAHFVFSSFGTCVPVPHPEDTGLDLHCTLTEREGQRMWPIAYYSMQVKSAEEPWTFRDTKSIRWLVDYPMPLFFCIVSKKDLSFAVYQTSGRFSLWPSGWMPETIRLVPGGDGTDKMLVWSAMDDSLNLGSPILRFSFHDTLDSTGHENIKRILQFWIDVDRENLFRKHAGMKACELPVCATNSITPTMYNSSLVKGDFEKDFKPNRDRLLKVLRWLADQYLTWGSLRAVLYIEIVIRQLKKDTWENDTPKSLDFIRQVITRFPTEPPGKTIRDAVEGLGTYIDSQFDEAFLEAKSDE